MAGFGLDWVQNKPDFRIEIEIETQTLTETNTKTARDSIERESERYRARLSEINVRRYVLGLSIIDPRLSGNWSHEEWLFFVLGLYFRFRFRLGFHFGLT